MELNFGIKSTRQWESQIKIRFELKKEKDFFV